MQDVFLTLQKLNTYSFKGRHSPGTPFNFVFQDGDSNTEQGHKKINHFTYSEDKKGT